MRGWGWWWLRSHTLHATQTPKVQLLLLVLLSAPHTGFACSQKWPLHFMPVSFFLSFFSNGKFAAIKLK